MTCNLTSVHLQHRTITRSARVTTSVVTVPSTISREIRHSTIPSTYRQPETTEHPSNTHHPIRTMLSTIAACLITLCASLAVLHQHGSQLSTARLYGLYTASFGAGTILLVRIGAEPWAYLLCGAGTILYTIIANFRRKYYGVSPKSSQNGNNRRARRRER